MDLSRRMTSPVARNDSLILSRGQRDALARDLCALQPSLDHQIAAAEHRDPDQQPTGA